MNKRQAEGWSRREFLGMTLAGTAGLLGLKPEPLAAEPPPETTTLRLVQIPTRHLRSAAVCGRRVVAERGVHRGAIRQERGNRQGSSRPWPLARLTSACNSPRRSSSGWMRGTQIVILAGGHVGCFELFGTERVRAIHDLKGKTVAVLELGSPQHVFLASIAAYVGLDPRRDIHWVDIPLG